MKKLRVCKYDDTYTMKEKCPKCGRETNTAHPPRYSQEDKYAEYRRREKYGKD